MKKVDYIILITGIMFWGLAAIWERSLISPPTPEALVSRFEQKIHAMEKEVAELMSDKAEVEKALSLKWNADDFKRWAEKPFNFLVFRRDTATGGNTLMLWTRNDVMPDESDISMADEVSQGLYSLKDKFCLMIQTPYQLDSSDYMLVAMIPIRYGYPVRNQYLYESFPIQQELSNYATLSFLPEDPVVKDSKGNELVHLKLVGEPKTTRGLVFIILLYATGLVMFTILIYRLAKYLSRNTLPLYGLLMFWAMMTFLQLGSGYCKIPTLLYRTGTLSTLFGTNGIKENTVGNFILNSFYVICIILYFFREFRHFQLNPAKQRRNTLMPALYYILIIGGIFFLDISFRQFMIYTNPNLSIGNILNFDQISLLFVLGLSTLILGYFLMSYRLISMLKLYKLPLNMKLVFLSVAIVILTAINYSELFTARIPILVISGILFILLMEQFAAYNKISPIWIVGFLVFFSLFSASLIYTYYKEKDFEFRINYAKKLAFERDDLVERNFPTLEREILKDNFIASYISSVFNPKAQLNDRLSLRYLDNLFFTRYDYEIHCYTADSFPLPGEKIDMVSIEAMLDKATQIKGLEGRLFFNSLPESTYEYTARLAFKSPEGLMQGTMYIVFRPKTIQEMNVYNEIMAETEFKQREAIRELEFAVYKAERLVLADGGNFPEQMNPLLRVSNPESSQRIEIGNKDYVVFQNSEGTIGIAAKTVDDPLWLFSLFSYMFCFLLVYMFALLLLNRLLLFAGVNLISNLPEFLGLRSQIQLSMVSVVLLTFVSIAFITVILNRRQLNSFSRDRLEKRVASATAAANERIAADPGLLLSQVQVNDLVGSLADVHKLVINVFDPQGRLLKSSLETFFDRRIHSRQMNAQAFYALSVDRENLFVNKEYIGSFSFQVAYSPLKSPEGTTVAFISIPYDPTNDATGDQDVASLLAGLLNVYVPLLLIAALVAVLIANSITRPLTALSDKMTQVHLDRPNEPLDWPGRDEIGTLINRYNNMIVQLSESTEMLAKTQKEMAWREMAKQVAHEIKNPLTPMKLNIQLMERALKSDPKQATDMFSRVSSVLIQQIDTLAQIATEFSNFAQMPQAQNERFNLNDIAADITRLYSGTDNIAITIETQSRDCFVKADKNQITRVLNNLVKNAIQAIPEEREGKIHISVTQSNNKALISVRDNGTGIPEDMQEKVFVPNFTTKNSGMGLGLAMSKNIIESAEGRIYYETETGVGTTFFVELPLFF